MTENVEVQPEQPEPRRASPAAIITNLNRRLDEKANQIRRLEDAEVALTALVQDLMSENEALVAKVREFEGSEDTPAEGAPASAADAEVPIQGKGTSTKK